MHADYIKWRPKLRLSRGHPWTTENIFLTFLFKLPHSTVSFWLNRNKAIGKKSGINYTSRIWAQSRKTGGMPTWYKKKIGKVEKDHMSPPPFPSHSQFLKFSCSPFDLLLLSVQQAFSQKYMFSNKTLISLIVLS